MKYLEQSRRFIVTSNSYNNMRFRCIYLIPLCTCNDILIYAFGLFPVKLHTPTPTPSSIVHRQWNRDIIACLRGFSLGKLPNGTVMKENWPGMIAYSCFPVGFQSSIYNETVRLWCTGKNITYCSLFII